jgi:ATP-binding cassette subfamily C protein
VIVAHRPSALAAVDLVLIMRDGRIQAFGPKDEILRQVLRPTPVPATAGTQQIQTPRPASAPPRSSVTLEESA